MIRPALAGLAIVAALLPAAAPARTLHLNCVTNPYQSEIWNLDLDKSLASSKYYDEIPVNFIAVGNQLKWKSAQFGFKYTLDRRMLMLVEQDGDGLAIYRCYTIDCRH